MGGRIVSSGHRPERETDRTEPAGGQGGPREVTSSVPSVPEASMASRTHGGEPHPHGRELRSHTSHEHDAGDGQDVERAQGDDAHDSGRKPFGRRRVGHGMGLARRRPRRREGRSGDLPSDPSSRSGGEVSRSGGEASRSVSNGFVDARAMESTDAVAKTLQRSAGIIGLVTRPKVIDFKARARERKRAGVRVVLIRVAATVAAVAALVGLCWLLLFSPLLRLESSAIEVRGANAWVSEKDVTDRVTRQSGRSLLLVDVKSMTESLTSIPGVSKAEVKRAFPHGLQVDLTAQRPAAMLRAGGDTLTAVDAKGRVLNAVSGASSEGIPVIEVKDIDRALKRRAIKESLKVLDAVPEGLRGRVSKVNADTQDSVTTEVDGGKHVIVWGDSSDMKLKNAIVDKILNDPNVIKDKHQIDVSAPARPVLR